MDKEIIQKLIELNRKFYSDNADAFDMSRKKYYWKLFEHILKESKSNFYKLDDNYIFIFGNLSNDFLNNDSINILDLGCGNGRLIEFLVNSNLLRNKEIKYTGIDFSERFLEITKSNAEKIKESNNNFSYKLLKIDLTVEKDFKKLDNLGKFDLIVGIAVIHHIPSYDLRKTLIEHLNKLLSVNGRIFLTSWDFLKSNSSKVVDSSVIGIEKSNLESNDYILTWKKSSYRYLCLIDSPSLIS